MSELVKCEGDVEREIEVEDVRENEGIDDYLRIYLKFVTRSIGFA